MAVLVETNFERSYARGVRDCDDSHSLKSDLNLAAAVQVFAYELRAAAEAPRMKGVQRRLAAHEQIEAFYEYLEQMMTDIGFLNREHPRKLMPRLRRLFARAELGPEEVNILRGILKALSRPRKNG